MDCVFLYAFDVNSLRCDDTYHKHKLRWAISHYFAICVKYRIYVNIAGRIFYSKIASMSEYNTVDIFGIFFCHMVSYININWNAPMNIKIPSSETLTLYDAKQRGMGRIEI